jgi:hypothetical protein
MAANIDQDVYVEMWKACLEEVRLEVMLGVSDSVLKDIDLQLWDELQGPLRFWRVDDTTRR